MTRDNLAVVLEDCRDPYMRDALVGDLFDLVGWDEDCTVPCVVFEREPLLYASAPSGMVEALVESLSACSSTLN